jgi:cell division protein FtsI/penicillin-binding protein 2
MSEVYNYNKRLSVIMLFLLVFTSLIVAKVFYLQVFMHDDYLAKALANQQGYLELEPKRGEIFLQDMHSGDDYRVATNITLDTVFADPSLIQDPVKVAAVIAPLLFNQEEALLQEEERLKEERKKLPADLPEEELNDILKPKPLDELKEEFEAEVLSKIGEKVRQKILLVGNPSASLVSRVNALGLSAVEADVETGIYLYPPRVSDPQLYAKQLSTVLDMSIPRLENLARGQNKYVVLAKAIDHEISEKLKAIQKKEPDVYKGLGFEEETYRYYPERNLASQVVGFMNSESGQYGMELHYEDLLKGEVGLFQAQIDGLGNQLTVGSDTMIRPAEDGANVYLTIDRSIQKEVENILGGYVDRFDANAGQVIVVDPKTGGIMAMANYPTFDPNEYWKVGEKEEFEFPVWTEEELEGKSDEEKERLLGTKKGFVARYEYATGEEIFYEEEGEVYRELPLIPVEDPNKIYDPNDPEANVLYYERYKNDLGTGVFRNRPIVDTYEPGSVFKPIAMSAAIDTGSVTPNTTMLDDGPIKVDEFTINNAFGKHYGLITMTQVLETSNNIGMAWIANKIGRELFYNYIDRFGFGEKLEIEFDDEKTGKLRKPNTWAESELATIAFGQGLTTTPLQMVMAYAALANDGVMMQPTLVKKIEYSNGLVDEPEPTVLRKVVSKKTADTLTAMLVSVIEKGEGGAGQVAGYSIAGKTGTAQTYKNGQPLEGKGTTMATFIGYGPAEDPEFVVLVRIEKPRSSQWAGDTAAPVFSDVAAFLMDYLNVPAR